MSNTPSDAELAAFADAFDWDGWIAPALAKRAFASAVLAKWGAPQPVVREPLTDEKAKAVLWAEHLRWMEAAGLDTEGMQPTGQWLDHWLGYVRTIEAAHGITAQGGAGGGNGL